MLMSNLIFSLSSSLLDPAIRLCCQISFSFFVAGCNKTLYIEIYSIQTHSVLLLGVAMTTHLLHVSIF